MVAERAARAFWPLWVALALILAPLLMGWHDLMSLELFWGFAVLATLGLGLTAFWGLRRFRWPGRAEAVARVDASLRGRPIAALADTQAIGAADPASQAVWQAHLDRMAARTRAARMVEPDLKLSARDPFGLRYIALLCFIVALLFGSLWRVGSVVEMGPGGEQILATGPVWEGWIEPPAYTGKPSIYLADVPPGNLSVPQGSKVTLRLYADVGVLTVAETVSGRTGELGSASAAQQSFAIIQGGSLAINGEGGAEWAVTLIPDLPPSVSLNGPVAADAEGQMSQPFKAADDFGVQAGQATIALDLAAVDRRHGLSVDPDAREPIVIDLPMPFSGDRAAFEDVLVENFSEHPFANLPVTVTLQVTDASGQVTVAEPGQMVLPGRRFFQPVARAVIEQRRDLLWSRANGRRVSQILKAVSNHPEDVFPNETTYLRLRVTLRSLDTMLDNGLTVAGQDEIAAALYELAVQLEDGTLADARERLRRAQERLSEAMRNGASDAEIAALMQELRDATDDYVQMLADNMQPGQDQTDTPQSAQQNNMEVTADEIQALMDRIQQLMEEGRMAEAAELMDQLNQLMENLQVTQGEGQGNGPRTPGQQSMQDLQDSLREQQDLTDEAFRDLQDQFNPGQSGPGQSGQDQPQGQPGQDPGQQPGQQGQDGQQPGDQPGQQGQDGQQPGQQGQDGQQGQGQGQGSNNVPGQQDGNGQGGAGADQQGTLADRQQALRDELNRQRGNLPNLSGEQADAAEQSLERAEGAMDGAEQALRDGDIAGAIDNQATAMDALREGLRSLGRALAENDAQNPGDGSQNGDATARVEPTRRDPLGREIGNTGQTGSDQNMLQGQDIYRRAEELLGEIRRRAAQQQRPESELDYLRRLLDRFGRGLQN